MKNKAAYIVSALAMTVGIFLYMYLYFENDGLNHVWTAWQKWKLFWPAYILILLGVTLFGLLSVEEKIKMNGKKGPK